MNANAAEDGAERVEVLYEPIEPVIDLITASDPDGPIIWPEGIPESEVDLAADHGGVSAKKKGHTGPYTNVNFDDIFERGDTQKGFSKPKYIYIFIYVYSVSYNIGYY